MFFPIPQQYQGLVCFDSGPGDSFAERTWLGPGFEPGTIVVANGTFDIAPKVNINMITYTSIERVCLFVVQITIYL